MERLTFIHTSDLHLDEGHPERLEVLRWLLAAAKEREAALLICGDLFDSDHQARILRPAVRGIFDEFSGVDVFILPGNHDAESYSAGDDYGQPVRMLSSVPVEMFEYRGLKVVAAPFVKGSNLAAALATVSAIEGPALLMAHGTYFARDSNFWKEVQERGAEYYPIYPQDLQGKPFSYVALGHFHSRFTIIRDSGAPLCYPGSPLPVTRAETGIRKAALVTLESGGVNVEPLPIGEGVYYISEVFDLLPELEDRMFSRLDAFLSENASIRAEVTISVKGSTQLSDAQINERIQGLKEAHSERYAGLKIDSGTQSHGGLLENSLVREFVMRLEEDASLDEKVRRLAVALGLRAFDAATSRRR